MSILLAYIRTSVFVVVGLLLFINTSGYANTTGIRITVLVVVVALFVLWLLLFWLRILPVYVSTTGFLLLVLLLCFTVVLVTNTTGCTNTTGLCQYHWLMSILPFLLLCLFCCFGY